MFWSDWCSFYRFGTVWSIAWPNVRIAMPHLSSEPHIHCSRTDLVRSKNSDIVAVVTLHHLPWQLTRIHDPNCTLPDSWLKLISQRLIIRWVRYLRRHLLSVFVVSIVSSQLDSNMLLLLLLLLYCRSIV